MNAADRVISRFGGQSALARLIGKRPSTVQHWSQTGIVPSKWQPIILEAARNKGISLEPVDFVPVQLPTNAGECEPPTALTEETIEPISTATWQGVLTIGTEEIPCYVLSDGRRVISRTGATSALIGKFGGGQFESYLNVDSLRPYLPSDLYESMIDFSIPGVVNKAVRGLSAELFLDICRALVTALNEGALRTDRQHETAIKAAMFLAACSKVGLIALIDEATGYQFAREEDALQFKLKLYLEEEMRKWEPTFPNELWKEFARLTNWKGAPHHRPKYWGKLVMEMVYGYLDPDVAQWLKENAPKPRHGQNYHQWLSSQYGLKKLVEHLWMLVGMASACGSMAELRRKMAEKYGRTPVQLTLYLPLD